MSDSQVEVKGVYKYLRAQQLLQESDTTDSPFIQAEMVDGCGAGGACGNSSLSLNVSRFIVINTHSLSLTCC